MRRWTIPAIAILSGATLALPAPAFVPEKPTGARPPVQDSAILGVFEGRTPCGPVAIEFTGFPATSCEKIKWELTLYADPASGAPAGYLYRGTRSSRAGPWAVRHGAAHDPDAVVYRLRYDPDRTLALLRVDENVLLILDPDLRVLVGDASWSYTLSRTDVEPPGGS